MTDEQPKEPTRPATGQGNATPKSPTKTDVNASAAGKPGDASKLTAEAQIALFEKDLKENDWGHQPC